MTQAKFTLGQIVMTPPCVRALEENRQGPREFLARHQVGNWGCVCESDKRANDAALIDGGRLLSAYLLRDEKTKIWIITEAKNDQDERASTCLLLPSDY